MRKQPEVTKLAVVDIETLGKGAGAKIASIGCAILDVKELTITGNFYATIDTKSQPFRYVDADTVEWWLSQAKTNPESFSELFINQFNSNEEKAIELEDALNEFSAFLKDTFGDEPVNMFGNGPEFDNVILDDAYNQLEIQTPWKYFNNQSVRTMLLTYRLVSGNSLPKVEFAGIKHHALCDAVHEAKIIAETIRYVRDGISETKEPSHAPAFGKIMEALDIACPDWFCEEKNDPVHDACQTILMMGSLIDELSGKIQQEEAEKISLKDHAYHAPKPCYCGKCGKDNTKTAR